MSRRVEMSERRNGPGTDFRKALDRAESGAPAAGQTLPDRFASDEIFQRIVASGDEEVQATTRQLFFSALAAGLAITLTFMAHVVMHGHFPDNLLLAALLYPIGFVYIVLGRYQLYTENTLPPVALVLTRLASIPTVLKIWAIVLAGNVVGSVFGVLALAHTGILTSMASAAAVEIGRAGIAESWWALFVKAIFAGWLVASVVWIDHAARDSAARFALVYLGFFAIPVLGLHHVAVSSCDAMYLMFTGNGGWVTGIVDLWLPVLLGNTIGGVLLVTVINYEQTREQSFPSRAEPRRRLTLRESLLGDRREAHATAGDRARPRAGTGTGT